MCTTSDDVSLMTFSACSFLDHLIPFSMGEENMTFADLLHVISNEFKVLEDRIDVRFASYRNELQELAREQVTRENFDISDLPCGSAPTVGCTEQPSPTVVRTAGVGSDTQGEFQTLKDSFSRLKLPSEIKLTESRQVIQRADQEVYHILTRCARYSETSLKLLSTIEPGTIITAETLEQFFLINQAQIQYLQDESVNLCQQSVRHHDIETVSCIAKELFWA